MIRNGFSEVLPNIDMCQLVAVAAHAYGKGLQDIVTCEASACALPPRRRFLVMAGTEEIRDLLISLRFTDGDIELVRELEPFRSMMTSSSLEQSLKNFRFTGDFWSMAEGEIAFAGEPLVRITGPAPEVMVAEACILPVLNHVIPAASKAARLVLASRGKEVVDVGTRGMCAQAAVTAARAAYLAGFAATSNVSAAVKYGIPVAGPMLHPWILLHHQEEEAFRSLGRTCKNSRSLGIVIDTNDVWNGTILASDEMSSGEVIVESGDPAVVVGGIRKILDANGKQSLKIMAAVEDEYDMDRICRSGVPVDGFLISRGLDNQCCDPMNITYDLVYNDTTQMPLTWISSKCGVLPGKKQVFLDQRNGGWSHLVTLESSVIQESEDLTPLLDCHILGGVPQDGSLAELEVARKYCNAGLLSLHPNLSSLEPKEEEDVPVYPHRDLKAMFDLAANRANKAQQD